MQVAQQMEQRKQVNVREAVGKIIASRKLGFILDQFHERMKEMRIGVALDGTKVSLSSGKAPKPEINRMLVLEHILSPLTVHGSVDDEATGKAMEMAHELTHELRFAKEELFSSLDFLVPFSAILKQADNVDDSSTLVRICMEVYAMHGLDSKVKKMAGSAQPELVVFMTDALVDALIAERRRMGSDGDGMGVPGPDGAGFVQAEKLPEPDACLTAQADRKAITPERYRSLVLTHLYIVSHRQSTAISRLDPKVLQEVGARPRQLEYRVFVFDVDIPENLQGRKVREMVRRIEAEMKENSALLTAKKEKRGRWVRRRATRHEDSDYDHGDEPIF